MLAGALGAFPNSGRYAGVHSNYTGPGDVVSGAKVWIGLRAYSAAIVTAGTQALVNLERTSDSHTCDIIVSATGGLGKTNNCSTPGDDGTAVATWCNGTTCNITEFYDQSGADACTGSTPCNFSSGVSADQPVLTFSCIGSLPCATFNGSSNVMGASASTTSSISQPDTISAVYREITDAGTLLEADVGDSANDQLIGAPATNNELGLNTNSSGSFTALNGSASNSATHAVQGIYNGASSNIYIDGSNNTGTLGADAFKLAGNSSEFGKNQFNGFCDCTFQEMGVWASGFNSTQLSNMNSNQHSYWGF